MDNTVIHGDSLEVLRGVPGNYIDLVLTDPPYGVDYLDRNGRTIAKERSQQRIRQLWHEVARVLRPNTFCISFYGWAHVDEFVKAWSRAGLLRAGHLVFPKAYTSGTGYVRYAHECAYLLVKGRPEPAANSISDVLEWRYSGNRRHPTEKSIETLRPLIEAFSKAGDLVLDPFAGSGSTLVAAALQNRRYLGIEIDGRYCEQARKRLDGTRKHLTLT